MLVPLQSLADAANILLQLFLWRRVLAIFIQTDIYNKSSVFQKRHICQAKFIQEGCIFNFLE